MRRPEILETWTYNWQTKERSIPYPLLESAKAIESIKNAFGHLKLFRQHLSVVSPDLKPEEILSIEGTADNCLNSYRSIMTKLEENVNAVRLFWFPETVEQLKVGAYKNVRQPVEEIRICTEEILLFCSICQEPLEKRVPIVFKRRCVLNPLLQKCCDLEICTCSHPSLCLMCGLSHLLTNGIHEGRSSIKCPACRGEVCIYDFQEVKIVPEVDEKEKLIKMREDLERQKKDFLLEKQAWQETE